MKSLLILVSIFISVNAAAQTVARVLNVQGNAFSFMGKNAVTLQYGSKIHDLSEVMVEDGATLSVVNTAGDVFHISGGSLAKFYKGVFELKNGYAWVKSSTPEKGLFNTANSVGQYGEGEFILSFDNINGKTQLLVLTGDVKFSNALEPGLNINVAAGFFSIVDPKYENGLPRSATKVGLQSYKELKVVFADFKDIQKTNYEETMWGEKKAKASRGIASVTRQGIPQASSGQKRGRLITITTYSGRTPASASGVDSPMKYYKEMKKRNAWKHRPIKNNKQAPVRYFGVKPTAETSKVKKTGSTVKRAIASVPKATKAKKTKKAVSRTPASIQKANLINDLINSQFEASLQREAKKIQRHPDEVNSLIDELKTYKQDFQKNY